jgi:TonB-dependent SusC/RagA subfamily outer membrane receptor
MPILFLYMLKLSCSLAVIWIFYRLLLRNLTFYDVNRWYLLGYSLLAFLIPLIDIGPALRSHRPDEPLVLQFIPTLGEFTPAVAHAPAGQTANWSAWTIASGILLLGVLFLVVRVVVRSLALRSLRRSATLIRGGKWKIYQVDEAITPFSFGNAIYINRGLHTEKEREEIILHEYGHVRGRHTVDILFAEWLTILNWYNPFAWLIRHSIRQNLEFIADRKVLAGGFDRKDYQYHLLKVVGQARYRLASNFNFSSLKKRIVMMNKLRTTGLHLVKFLFILPLLAVLLVAFRENYSRIRLVRPGSVNVGAAGVVPGVPGRAGAGLADTVPGPRRDTVRIVTRENARRRDSLRIITRNSGESRDSLRTTGRDTVRIRQDSLRASETGFGERPHQEVVSIRPWPPQPPPLFIIDGIEKDTAALRTLNPTTIQSIEVLKDSSSVARYGPRGRNGVILIHLKPGSAPKP